MNKVYASILLITIFPLFTTCMKKERTSNIQKKKQLIPTNSITQPNSDLLSKEPTTAFQLAQARDNLRNQLHTAARNLNRDFDSSQLITHKSLVNFITLMNNAKRFNITEYDMAQFAHTIYDTDYFNHTTLYFHCLQNYNNAEEELPFTADDLDNEFCLNSKLAQTFKTTYKYHSMQDIENKIKDYPAYTNLINQLKLAADRRDQVSDVHKALCMGLHSGAKKLLRNDPQYNDITSFDDFYAKATGLLWPCSQNVYLFHFLIKRLKNIEQENDEKTIFSKILNYQPQPKDFFGIKYGSSIDERYLTTFVKHKFALMYTCMEQYNRNQGYKIIPTSEQDKAFLSYTLLNINLPDDFDKTVFNEKKYAFKEFSILVDNMLIVQNATETELNQLVKKMLNEI